MLNNNTLSIADITFSAKGYLPDKAVLKDIRVSYKKNTDGNFTRDIDATRYHCISPENFDTFIVKVCGKEPIIDPEDFKKSEDNIFVEIPVSEALIKPYEIAYGKVKVSIIAPFVKLSKN